MKVATDAELNLKFNKKDRNGKKETKTKPHRSVCTDL